MKKKKQCGANKGHLIIEMASAPTTHNWAGLSHLPINTTWFLWQISVLVSTCWDADPNLLFKQSCVVVVSVRDTYTLSLAHLMEVGPPTDDDYLGIAWIAQVCCQLPLSWPVPAHVEEYLDDDEYDDNSGEKKRTKVSSRTPARVTSLHKFRAVTHMYQYSSISMDS